MFSISTICSLCLEPNLHLQSFLSKDIDGVVIEEKIKVFLLELVDFKPSVKKYICSDCLVKLSYIHKFREKCLENMTKLSELVQSSELKVQTDTKNDAVNSKTCIKENETTQNVLPEVECVLIKEEPCVIEENQYNPIEDIKVKMEENDNGMLKNIQTSYYEVFKEFNEEKHIIDGDTITANTASIFKPSHYPRFGNVPINNFEISVPKNTIKSKTYMWKQFKEFCAVRKYEITKNMSMSELNDILLDWALNMKKQNGTDYKESVIKTLWNQTAKHLQEMFYSWGIKIDPFTDIEFRKSREARNAKRQALQSNPATRKVCTTILTFEQYRNIVNLWNEDNPEGLNKKFYFIATLELNWHLDEATNCLISYFKIDIHSNKISYNPAFSNRPKRPTHTKWLLPNVDQTICPVRIFKKLLSKRTGNINIDRLFLAPHQSFCRGGPWYKNNPIGPNMIAKWTKESAEMIGLNTKVLKFKLPRYSIGL